MEIFSIDEKYLQEWDNNSDRYYHNDGVCWSYLYNFKKDGISKSHKKARGLTVPIQFMRDLVFVRVYGKFKKPNFRFGAVANCGTQDCISPEHLILADRGSFQNMCFRRGVQVAVETAQRNWPLMEFLVDDARQQVTLKESIADCAPQYVYDGLNEDDLKYMEVKTRTALQQALAESYAQNDGEKVRDYICKLNALANKRIDAC